MCESRESSHTFFSPTTRAVNRVQSNSPSRPYKTYPETGKLNEIMEEMTNIFDCEALNRERKYLAAEKDRRNVRRLEGAACSSSYQWR